MLSVLSTEIINEESPPLISRIAFVSVEGMEGQWESMPELRYY